MTTIVAAAVAVAAPVGAAGGSAMRAGGSGLGVVVLALCAGCAGTESAPAPLPAAPVFAPTPGAPFAPRLAATAPPAMGPFGLDEIDPLAPDTLATIDGVPITKREVADFLFVDQPAAARRLIEDLVLARILRKEVERTGVFVSEEAVAARVASDRAMRVKAASAAGLSLDDYTRAEFGVSAASYERLAPVLVRSRMLRARVVRYAQVLEDRAEARIIVVESREHAERVIEQLAQGADFATIARQASIHATHRDGGLLPPVARWGIEPDLEAELFKLVPGSVSAPIRVERLKNGQPDVSWAVLKCLRFRPARDVSYSDVRDEIERELESRPLQTSPEWAGWIAKMQRRYRIDRFYEPRPGARTTADTEIGAGGSRAP